MINLLLAAAAFTSGIVTALAGGGAFLTFPALMASGMAPVEANATSTVALFPGQAMTAWASRASRSGSSDDGRIDVRTLSIISLAGGLAGAILLLATPSTVFAALVPWLLLGATLVFAGGVMMPGKIQHARLSRSGVYAAQTIISIYGGYFGGGIGILMLAALTLYGLSDIRFMNSVKILMATLMNASAVATFVAAGRIGWPETIAMAFASTAGGYAGAHLAKTIPGPVVRSFVIAVGLGLSFWYFWRGL